MLKSEALLTPLIRRCIHDDVQIFLQQEVARPLRKAFKRGRATKDVMIAMRDVGGDWLDRSNVDDYKQKKKVLVQVNRDFPRRWTGPTLTQVILSVA